MSVEGKVSSNPATDCKNFSLSDANVISMDNVVPGESPFPKAFIPDVTGVLSILNVYDVVVNIPVNAGNIYPIYVKKFLLTGTTGVTSVVGLS